MTQPTATGKLPSPAKSPTKGKTDAAITLVLRDKRGNIIYGDTTFVDGLKNGQPKAFDMTEYDLPDYASYELYGKCW